MQRSALEHAEKYHDVMDKASKNACRKQLEKELKAEYLFLESIEGIIPDRKLKIEIDEANKNINRIETTLEKLR